MHAKEYLARDLPVAESLCDEVHDPPLGVGEAVPAKGRAVGVRPVMQPGAQGTQPGSDSCHGLGAAKLLILRICVL